MGKVKTGWFGKRWTKSLLGWMDSLCFSNAAPDGFETMGASFCACFTIGLIGGLIMVPLSLIYEQDTVVSYLIPLTALAAVLWSTIYLWNHMSAFNSAIVKVARVLYVVILNLIGCAVALYIGMWAALAVIALLFIWLLLSFGFDSNSSKKIRLEDGTELTVSRGILGEKYYKDSNGTTYRETSPGVFQKC